MKREKVIELAAQAGMNPNRNEKAINALFSSVPVHWLEHFARLVEQETLERAISVLDTADKKNPYEKWSPGAPSAIIKKLKDDHDKE